MARTMEEIRAAVDKLHELEADETVSWIAFQETMAHAEEMARREEAVKEGIKNEMTQIAKNMLKDGVKIEDIIKYTGLTNEELEKLKI